MKWYHILTLVGNQIAVIVEAVYDIYQRKRKGKATHHVASAWFRGLSWTIAAVGIHYSVMGASLFLGLGLSLLYAHLLAFQYWLTFNPIYNRFDGTHWWYGNKGFFDSILEGKEFRYKNLMLKAYLVVLFAFFYFLFYGSYFNNK